MKIEENKSLESLTTLRARGTARYFCIAENVKELREALGFARDKNILSRILGRGSNTLIGEVFSGIIIKLNFLGTEWKDSGAEVFANVSAGEEWDSFVAEAVARGLYGVENLSGIPGTVGASPIQNIGAYGAEAKDTIDSVDIFDTKEMKMCTLTKNECRFGYRTSIFKDPEYRHYIVVSVSFRLLKKGVVNLSYKDVAMYFADRPTCVPTPATVRNAVLEIRRGKFPLLTECGTAGSFFKNPIVSQKEFERLTALHSGIQGFLLSDGGVKLSLAWIFDNILLLKGFRKGAVGLYEKQPLVLINFGGADANEIEMFAREIAERVHKATDIRIEWEVEKIS